MTRSQRRLVALFVSLPLALLSLAWIYQVGMENLEEDPRTFLQSLQWAAETITSTGYGEDGRWEHPLMAIYVVIVQFLGLGLVFLVFPFYLVPFFEERFEGRLPRKLPSKLRDHVLVYRHGAAVAGLYEELERRGVPCVIFEEDEGTARRLLEKGHKVISGRLEDGDPDYAAIDRARAIVANGSDHDNGAMILRAREQGFGGEVLSLATDPFHREPMIRAGADVVYTPRHVLAAALAAKASSSISPRVSGLGKLGTALEVREFRLPVEGELAGLSARELSKRLPGSSALMAASVAGEWVLPQAKEGLSGGLLWVVGSPSELDEVAKLLVPLSTEGSLVVGGHGEVGQKVSQLLRDVGEGVKVIDVQGGDATDVEGDLLDHQVLKEAGVPDSRGIIVSLSSDNATIFATSVIRSVAPTVPIIARVNRHENIERIYRSGADFALSLADVAGRLLSAHLISGSGPQFDRGLDLREHELSAAGAGMLSRAKIQEETGATVVAVRRQGAEELEPAGHELRVEAGDALLVAATPQGHANCVRRWS